MSSHFLVRRPQWPRGLQWLVMPLAFVQVLRDRRSVIPAPRIYMGAALLGVLLGVALDLMLGWPWRVVGLGVLVAVWPTFLSSAFFGPDRASGLGDDLLMKVDPNRWFRRRRRLAEDAFRNPPFTLYGLPSTWEGGRRTYGWRFSGRFVTSLSLQHVTAGDHAVELRVEVSVPELPEQLQLRRLAGDLWDATHGPPSPLGPGSIDAWNRQRESARQGWRPVWETIRIPVDGDEGEFRILVGGVRWVAHARLNRHAIQIHGCGFPPEGLELVTIHDVEPYIRGAREGDEGATGRED